MHTDIDLTDKGGKSIEIKVPEPKYMSEVFSLYHAHEKPILTEQYKKMQDVFVNQNKL